MTATLAVPEGFVVGSIPSYIYYAKAFDAWDEAVAAQKKVLQEAINGGFVIRSCELNIERDFDTKKQRYCVFIRSYAIEQILEGHTP